MVTLFAYKKKEETKFDYEIRKAVFEVLTELARNKINVFYGLFKIA